MLIECGKYLLCMKVYIHIISYWIRLSLDNKYKKCYRLKKKMDGKGCCLKIVEYLMKYVNYDKEYYDIIKDKDLLKRNLRNLRKMLVRKKQTI